MPDQIEVPVTPADRVPVAPVPQGGVMLSESATHNYRAVQVVWMITGLITTLLAIRFILKLLGASTQSGFVSLIYGMTDALAAPFRAIFPTTGQDSTLDVAALVAIAIYALVGWGIVAVVKLTTSPRGARSVS